MSRPVSYLPQQFGVPVDLDLSKNEGRTGAAKLLATLDDPDRVVTRYPDTTELRRALADLHGLSEDSVLVTAGGDDALFRCFLARVSPGRQVVSTKPTFEMISRYSEQRAAELIETPWWTGPFPSDELIASITDRTDAAFIVSPNNPTGSVATARDLERIAAEAPLLVLDAAYSEFASDDLTQTALGLGNAVVIRTLSKAYGLAGLRVGCLLGPPALVAEIGAHGNPFPVASISAALATTRLSRPTSDLLGFVEEVKRERVELTTALERLGTKPLRSEANFVLTECRDPSWLTSAAAAMGVGLRQFPDRTDLRDTVRITLPGDPSDFQRLIDTLEKALAPEALVFDLDGVLADVSRSQSTAIIETARSFGADIDATDIEQAKSEGNSNDDWLLTQSLCRQKGIEIGIEVLTERYESLYQGSNGTPGLKIHESPIVDSATWSRWAGFRPLAVVTGRPRADAEEFLDRFALSRQVSALVTRDDAPLKPDPAPVGLALQMLGVRRAWMLGDTPDDLVAAREAGVIPIGVIAPGDDPKRSRLRLRNAARILENTNQLEALLP